LAAQNPTLVMRPRCQMFPVRFQELRPVQYPPVGIRRVRQGAIQSRAAEAMRALILGHRERAVRRGDRNPKRLLTKPQRSLPPVAIA